MYLHLALIGLAPLIPVPVLDDWAKTFFQRRLVADLAAAHSLTLTPAEVEILADDHSGCVSGCLAMLVMYPAKKILRKVFFVLEWQRALNTLSHAYYHAHLLNAVFERGWPHPGDLPHAWRVRRAVDAARRTANTRLLNQLSARALNHSRDAAQQLARQLTASLTQVHTSFQAGLLIWLRRISPRWARAARQRFPRWTQRRQRQEEALRARLQAAHPETWPGVADLAQALQTAWNALPAQHLAELESRLWHYLEQAG